MGRKSSRYGSMADARARIKMLRDGVAPAMAGTHDKAAAKRDRILLALGFVLSVGFVAAAMHLSGGGLPLEIGALGPGANALLFGKTPPSVLGAGAADAAAAVLARALALCLAAGVLPLLTFVWLRLRDNVRANLYIAVVSVTVNAPLVYLFVDGFFWPLLQDVISVFI